MHGNYYFKYKMVAKPGASCAYILRTAPKNSTRRVGVRKEITLVKVISAGA